MSPLKIMLGVVLAPMVLIGGCSANAWHRDRAAKRFCESLIPQIEQARTQSGQYPIQANPDWWADQQVPVLIQTEIFYARRSDGFRFWFQNDSWVFDNVWEFDGKYWFSYDANRKAK